MAESPVAGGDSLDEGFFYDALGLELGADVGEQGVEVGSILVWGIGDDVCGQKPVPEGVSGKAGLATGGLGAGR